MRLRLTSDGKLRYCLFAREETDIKPLLKGEDEALETAIRTTIWQKWAGHEISRSSFVPPQRPMYRSEASVSRRLAAATKY